ncbi:hypothetical protein ACLB2K_051980 [Fragaria x ananassa]
MYSPDDISLVFSEPSNILRRVLIVKAFILSCLTTSDVVEGESKLLIDYIHCQISVLRRIKVCVHNILKLDAQFDSIAFRHIYREANFVADHLALFAHSHLEFRLLLLVLVCHLYGVASVPA